MLLFAIIAVFVAGLMVGRTPEYLGKKIESKEVKMAMLAILILPFSILGFTALAAVLPAGLAGLNNSGPHGFSEMLYAYHLGDRQQWQRLCRSLRQHHVLQSDPGGGDVRGPLPDDRADAGRGRLAGRPRRSCRRPPAPFPTDGPLFVGLVVGVILIVGGLTFFPSLALGPIVEHFAMLKGTFY